MIMLGAFLERKPLVSIDSIIAALKKVLPERYHHLLDVNRKGIEVGSEIMKSLAAVTK